MIYKQTRKSASITVLELLNGSIERYPNVKSFSRPLTKKRLMTSSQNSSYLGLKVQVFILAEGKISLFEIDGL